MKGGVPVQVRLSLLASQKHQILRLRHREGRQGSCERG